jgi:hypothetical protein
MCRCTSDGVALLQVSKNVPQRLKPSSKHVFTARLKPCPSSKVFPTLTGVLYLTYK